MITCGGRAEREVRLCHSHKALADPRGALWSRNSTAELLLNWNKAFTTPHQLVIGWQVALYEVGKGPLLIQEAPV